MYATLPQNPAPSSRVRVIGEISDGITPEYLHGEAVHRLAAVILYDRLDVRLPVQASLDLEWALVEARRGIESSQALG